jgi:hypothetical protein
MLNLGSECTPAEEMLMNFQEAVRRNDADLRAKLIKVLDYFKFVRVCVYQKGRNKIEAISKEGE